MSYILEALKKAEAQRGRGDVPGLDAQHMPAEPLALQPPPGGHGLLMGIIMVLGVLVIGLLLWSGRDSATSTPGAGTAPPPPTQGGLAPAAVPATRPSPDVVPQTVLVPPPDASNLPRHFQDMPAVSANLERPRTGAASHKADAPLPEDLKAQFPRLSFGGAMHSDNAASRMLIVNGQLHREGDTVAPDLVLQRIELKSATFRFKGHTHTVQY